MELGDLTGTRFKGTFRRNPGAVEGDLLAVERYPECFTPAEKAGIERDKEDISFVLEILSHDPTTGLFLAKAEDSAGQSGIVGAIKEEWIKFDKLYPRKSWSIGDEKFFRKFHYIGQIRNTNGNIMAGGEYEMEGCNEQMAGNWSMWIPS